MKHRRKGSDDDSSEDEHIIEQPTTHGFAVDDGPEEEDEDDLDFFENSQELTQPIPRRSDPPSVPDQEQERLSPKKKSKKKKKNKDREEELELDEPDERETRDPYTNGYRVREMDVSEIPGHILKNMKRVLPAEGANCSGELTVETLQKAATSSKGGVWILKCPKDLNLSDLLSGKKISLDDKSTIFDNDEEDDSPQLTQFVPTNSLGFNVKDRQFEATPVSSEEYKNGAVLMIPDANKYKLVATPIQGHIIIRECVKELPLPQISTPKSKSRKLPQGIKERHPVYGADFTKIVEQMESAPKKRKSKSLVPDATIPFSNRCVKLENDDESFVKQKKKKHKKSKDNNFESENGYVSPPVKYDSSFENGSSKKNKSKKRTRDELEESYNDLDKTVLIGESCEPAPKKLKSKHRH